MTAQTSPASPASPYKRHHPCPPSPSNPPEPHPPPLTSSHPSQPWAMPSPAPSQPNPSPARPASDSTPPPEILGAKQIVISRNNSYRHCNVKPCDGTRGFQGCFGQGRGPPENPETITLAVPVRYPTSWATVIVRAIRSSRSHESSSETRLNPAKSQSRYIDLTALTTYDLPSVIEAMTGIAWW